MDIKCDFSLKNFLTSHEMKSFHIAKQGFSLPRVGGFRTFQNFLDFYVRAFSTFNVSNFPYVTRCFWILTLDLVKTAVNINSLAL